MIDVIISFLLSFLDRALPTTGLSAQQSKALGVLVLYWAMHHFLSLAFPLRLSSDKAREKNKTAKLFPLLHTSLTWEDSLQHALAFYLSIYFIPFWFRVVDIGLLTLEPSTFARKKGGSKTLILDTLYIYHTSFRSSRFLSVSRIVDFWILISSLSLPITWFNLRIVGFLLLMDSFVRH